MINEPYFKFKYFNWAAQTFKSNLFKHYDGFPGIMYRFTTLKCIILSTFSCAMRGFHLLVKTSYIHSSIKITGLFLVKCKNANKSSCNAS